MEEESSAAALSQEQTGPLLELHRRTGKSLGHCMVDMGWPDEAAGLRALAHALRIRFLDLAETKIDPAATAIVPAEILQRAHVMPVSMEDGRLLLAMEDPFDFETVDHIRILTGREVERAICTENDLHAAMKSFHGFTVERMIEQFAGPKGPAEQEQNGEIGHLREMASEPTVVNLVNRIIARAVRDHASDIHIEPFGEQLKVKYRIDGILHEMPSPPKHLHPAIISRVKIMSQMNIAERYLPQDGHMELDVEGAQVDVRVATIPTMHGECVALRLLDKSSFLLSLEELGLEERTLARYRRLLEHPHGIILGLRPHGQRQDDHALRHPLRHLHAGAQVHHPGGAGRVRAAGRQPDPCAPQARADLCQRPAGHRAPGPGHHHGRRDP